MPEVMDRGIAQRVMNRIFARYEKSVTDFKKLPLPEQKYVAERCPGFDGIIENGGEPECE